MDTIIRAPQPSQLNRALRGDTYLRLQLAAHAPAVLLVEYVQEVMLVPAGRLTPMPNMPKCMLGLLNRRNRIIWVVDLAHLLHLQPTSINTGQYNIAIIRVGQVPLGLVVQAVKGVTRLTSDCIQSVQGLVPSHVAPYLNGGVLQNREILLVLNAEAIISSPTLRSN